MEILKNFLILFIFLFLLYSCTSPSSPEKEITSQISSTADTLLTDSLKNLYYDDAALLAIADMNKDFLLKDSIHIPNILLDKYYSKLIAVYNAFDIQKAQEVKSIHNYTAKVMKLFVIGVDTSSQWIKNLIEGSDTSGNADIDQILSEYNINIFSIHNVFNIYHFRFETGFYVNIYPFLQLFENIENILYAEPEVLGGGGNLISLSKDEDNTILIYSKGWGDCRAGCIYRHYWDFDVNDNLVTFLKEYGDKIP